MSVQAASGYPQHSGILIPEVWSGKMLVEFYEVGNMPSITNNDYEGEIKNAGDTVHIRSLPEIIVRDYTKGQPITYDDPQEGLVSLLIDKAKIWNFKTDIVDEKQSDLNFAEKRTTHAAKITATEMETDFNEDIIGEADSHNTGNSAGVRSGNIKMGALGGANGANHVGLTSGASGTGNKRNILDWITDMTVIADEAKWPTEGRWIELPSWACKMIRMSDLKDASLTGDAKSPLRNGLHGEVDGWMIYKSNLVYGATDTTSTSTTPKAYHIPFGHTSGITFASQFTDTHSGVGESFVGRYYRGLNVYGYEVIKPTAFGISVARPALSTDT